MITQSLHTLLPFLDSYRGNFQKHVKESITLAYFATFPTDARPKWLPVVLAGDLRDVPSLC